MLLSSHSHINQTLLVAVLSSEIHTVLTVNPQHRDRAGDVANDFIAWNFGLYPAVIRIKGRSADGYATFVTDLQGVFLFQPWPATLTSSSASARALARSSSRRSSSRQAVKDGDSPNPAKTNRANKGLLLSCNLILALLSMCLRPWTYWLQVMLVELGHQEVTATVNRQFLVLIFKELTDLVARLAGLTRGPASRLGPKELALVLISPDLPSEVWYWGAPSGQWP